MIVLRFVRSKGFTSDMTAWREQTAMPFSPSHVECVTPDGKWLGQHVAGGMLARPAGYDHDDVAFLSDGRRAEIFVSLPATPEQTSAFYAAATVSIDEPYDWRAIIGFAVPFHEHLPFHAICSAKMVLLLRTKGCEYFPWPLTVPAHLITPRDLMLMLSAFVEIPH